MAQVAIEDLSGQSTPVTGNPFDGLIAAANGDSKQIQARYDLHRSTRNSQQREKILNADFSGWVLDEYLVKLDGPMKDPKFVDPRNCLVFWARPPASIRNLVGIIQQKLRTFAPDLWLMPLDDLHMTAMEVAHSSTAGQIDHLVSILLSNIDQIANLPYENRARLIKPMVSYDAAALALSYVPASGEGAVSNRGPADDEYSYHHLRRDIYAGVAESGAKVASRYVVPSAHLTIARYNTPNVFGGDVIDTTPTLDASKRKKWVKEIETINKWLEAEYWPRGGLHVKPGGGWLVGEEKGLDVRRGRLWYGGGETIRLGRSF